MVAKINVSSGCLKFGSEREVFVPIFSLNNLRGNSNWLLECFFLERTAIINEEGPISYVTTKSNVFWIRNMV
jgi:hypothetical protein